MSSSTVPVRSGSLNKKKVVISIDFGTSRTGFCYSLTNDVKKTRVKNTSWKDAPSGVSFPKTLTQLLYEKSDTRKPVAWGYTSLDMLSREFEDESESDEDEEGGEEIPAQNSKYYHFKTFKMGLFNNPSGMVKDTTGVFEKNVGELIVDYLKLLFHDQIKPTVEKSLGSKLNLDEVTWCLTVPAIWKDEQKSDMRLAAYTAGLTKTPEASSDDFKIILEPEGAAAYCMEYQASKGKPLREGESFLVCDLGGGTVDLTCHKFEKARLRELAEGSGDACGSTYLDDAFIIYLEECFGKKFVETLRKKYGQTYLDILKIWERTKVTTTDLTKDINVDMPGQLSSFLESANVKSDKFRAKRGQLKITSEALQTIYQDSLEKTRNLVEKQLETIQSETGKMVDYIFIVGGFGASKVVQNFLIDNFSSQVKGIVIPNEPAEAVVDGAALLGIDDSLISTRRMRMTYGVKAQKGSEEIFDTFVIANQELEVDQGISREYKVQRANQQAMKIIIYSTKLKSITKVDETKCHKIGEIQVHMTDMTGGMDRIVKVTMYFGRSETRVTAIEKNTGIEYSALIKYDGELFSHGESIADTPPVQPHHLIFANDVSGSMWARDALPTMSLLKTSHNNRVGALYEACYAFLETRKETSDISSCILHNHDSIIIYDKKPATPSLVSDYMMKYNADGGNNFLKVFETVEQVLKSSNNEEFKPIVFFMTDGAWHDDGAPAYLEGLMLRYPDLTVHVINLGSSINFELMNRIAKIGRGTISTSGMSAVELKSTYLSLLPYLD
ncbi:chaperone protein [Naegleria gruberi]|uniref:Chaperone protein n=1 Tax=Naegleria gruberi TaxID=5762 RepID=D2V8K0_NAEGR|nr:chaperone protein [Naegleria gruberi]EFC46700.1 chaperone protein [Naegleria gruberi]|eukprot:XP_002679444.1 chaperone protein [Naegleria gruberi strain NEG-M]